MANLSTSRVLRPGELAERLGISRVTLWRWERAGHLPPKRQIGPNVVGWLEQEIDEWFEGTADCEHPDGEAEKEGARERRAARVGDTASAGNGRPR